MDGRRWLPKFFLRLPTLSQIFLLIQKKRRRQTLKPETRELSRWLGSCKTLTRWAAPLVNNFRTARVAEVLADFQSIQYYIASAPVDPINMDDYYTEGWSTLRQCNLDGQRILNCGADTRVPEASGGPDEQAKAELKLYVCFHW